MATPREHNVGNVASFQTEACRDFWKPQSYEDTTTSMSWWISQTARAAFPDDSDPWIEVTMTCCVRAGAIRLNSTSRVHGNDQRLLEFVTCKVTSAFVHGCV